MKGLLLNTLLGLAFGRFGGVWMLCALVPVVAAELLYGYYVYQLGFSAGLRRGRPCWSAASWPSFSAC